MEIQITVSGYLYKTAKNVALDFIRNEHTHRVIIDKLRKAHLPMNYNRSAD